MGYSYKGTECHDGPEEMPESMSEAPWVDGYFSDFFGFGDHPAVGNQAVRDQLNMTSTSTRATDAPGGDKTEPATGAAEVEKVEEADEYYVPLDEMLPLDGDFEYLLEEDVNLLSPDDQEAYFNREEAQLYEFFLGKQEARIDELGEEAYRQHYPDDAARYLGGDPE